MIYPAGKSKLPNIGTSIFAVMSKMAADYDAINLSQGFPDFNCSEELIELVNFNMRKGYNQYAPMPGTLELRKQIALNVKKDYDREYNFDDEITITSGATQALYTAFSTIISPGDEVIIFEPAYDSYLPAIKLNSGIPINIPLNKNDFSIPWNKVQRSITKKTKCMVFNSPHNPTGSILREEDITELIKLVKGTDIFLISDEVYEHIIFDNKSHLSFARYDELARRSFVISSFGKTVHTTGWKIGYCCAPSTLTNEFRKIHQFIIFSVNTPIQLAIAKYIQEPNNISKVNRFYENKRNLLTSLIKNSRFKLRACNGTYFQLLDYNNISKNNDLEFCEYLTKEIGVAVIPLSPFYIKGSKEKLIRLCFAKKDEILQQASVLLCKI